MFEIRWVEFGSNRQLEYRQLKVRVDASGAITPLPMPIEWTDWVVVPIVSGDEAAIEDLIASGGIVGD